MTSAKSPATTVSGGKTTHFRTTYVLGLGPPQVRISNETNKTISVTLSGPKHYRFTIPALDSTTEVIEAGTYSYEGRAIGVSPCSGTQNFETDHRYTWTFTIVTYPSIPY